MHILSPGPTFPHTNLDRLVKAKIPALSKRAAKYNKDIIEDIALNGPSLQYKVCKSLGLSRNLYGTINRRIHDLTSRGYLARAGTKRTERGRQTEENLYGLTWRGFITSLSIAEVRKNILLVLENNPLLAIPEKELVLPVLENVFTQQETEKIAASWLHNVLNSISNIETIGEGELRFFIFLSAMKDLSGILDKPTKRENLLKLLDNPKILENVKRKMHPLKAAFERQIQALSVSLAFLDGIEGVLASMKQGELPSEKLDEFFRSDTMSDSPGGC